MTDGAFGPGSTIGILGGGQLGRMMAIAAGELGLNCHIYCPDADSPAFDVSAAHFCAAYDDEAALAEFAAGVDVITYEFENVPDKTAEILSAARDVFPDPKILTTTQDRLFEKRFLKSAGLSIAPFAEIDRPEDLAAAIASIGTPAVLKTRRLGYDGKGQTVLDHSTPLEEAFDTIGNAPAVLEAMVPLDKEISVIAARGRTGETLVYDIAENVHENHILSTTRVPARISGPMEAEARAIGEKIAIAFDYVGILAVELFVVNNQLLVNEIAPRVHNSGHWTQDGCLVSQFEQHIRAVAGWPLAGQTRHSDVIMTNLLGDETDNWQTLAAKPGAHVHIYGKAEARQGRKMGHINQIFPLGKAP